jgi:striatin 1/3/4
MDHPQAAIDREPMGYTQQLSEARWQRSLLALPTLRGRTSLRFPKTPNREREVENISSSACGSLSHFYLAVPRCATCESRLTHRRCLQEITYLTSPGALNPLPAGPPISVERSVSPAGSDFPAGSEASAPLERPRKVLAENPPPSLLVREPGTSALSELKPEIPNGASRDETPASLPDGAQEAAPSEAASLGAAVPPPQGPSIPLVPKAQADARGLNVDSASQPPSSPLPRPMPLPEEPTGEDPGKQILTAIYRPDSKAAWREELRAANEQAEKVGVHGLHEALFATFSRRKNRVCTDPFQAKAERSAKTDEQSDEEQLASLTFNVDEEDVKPDDSIERVWTSRRSLKSHLDIVRAVAFGHGPGIVFASAGDDCSVKVWSVESAAVMLTR